MELEIGVQRIERRDAPQGAWMRSWLDTQIVSEFEGRLLGVDTRIARVCAGLHVPDPRHERDALIAATAMVHGLIVVTRNIRDCLTAGVTVINPWQTPPA
jgi:predicted nucleic acid-binding protein